MGATHYGTFENCVIQDDTTIPIPAQTELAVDFFDEQYQVTEAAETYVNAMNHTSEFKDSVLNYIAGYIQRKVFNSEMCVFCREYLGNLKIVEHSGLYQCKNKGGLTIPSTEFCKVVRIANSVYESIISDKNPLTIKNLVQMVQNKVMVILTDKYPLIFEGMDEHVQSLVLGSHKVKIVKKIIGCLVSMRSKHLCKTINSGVENLRVHYSKLILLQHF